METSNMNCYGGKDLARSYRTVRENTIKIAEEIPETKYDFTPAPGLRTVRQLLTHIALADSFSTFHRDKRTSFAGVNFPAFLAEMQAEEAKLRSKEEVIAFLKERGENTAKWLESLSDEFLAEQFTQPAGPLATKSRFEMIMGMKEHEMHHRGQLMLIERMLGIVPHLTRQMQERFAAAQART
jgi:uncharacterized damage-inducible protein DinB